MRWTVWKPHAPCSAEEKCIRHREDDPTSGPRRLRSAKWDGSAIWNPGVWKADGYTRLSEKKNKVGGMYPCVLCTMYRDIVVPVSKAVGSRESGALSLFWFSLHVWLRSMSQPPTGACPKFIQQLPAMKSRQLPIFFLALLIAPVFAVKEVGIRLCCPVLPVPACLVVPGPRRRAHTVLRYLEGPFFPLLLPFIPSLHFLRLPLPPRGLPDTTNAALQSLDTCGEVDDR